MLVLTRRVNESIVIGDSIEVKVLEVRGDQVKLGVQAPRRVPVHRKEVFEEIVRENRLAAEAAQVVSEDVAALLLRKGEGRTP